MGDPERTRLDVGRCGLHLDLPGRVLDAVRDLGVDAAQHALRRVGCVVDGEGDGVVGEVVDVPGPERPVVGAAVQRIVAVVLLGVVRLVADGVVAIAYAVDVAAGDGVVDRVARVLG